jgi:hypothetical protein
VHPGVQDIESQVSPDTWITKIGTCVKDNILPDDSASVDRIVRVAKRYTLVEGDLYRHGANNILMRYITREEGCELLVEDHASSHTLVGKAF